MDTYLNYTSLLSLGTKWFEFIVDVTVKGTIILILAYFVNFVWRRASAAARNLVWNLAVVSLLIVPLFSLVLPEWEVSIFSYNQTEKQYFHADNAPSSLFNEQQTENLTNNEESAGNISTITEPLSDGSQNSSVIERAGLFIKNVLSNLHWSVWLMLLWLFGALFVFARLLVGYTIMRRITKHFIPVNNRIFNCIAADYAGETGIKRTIQLLQCSRIAVPMTRGWLKPKIILPEEALSWSEKRRKSVLLHELAHVKRLDYLSSFVVHAVSVLYWFNPLVWVAVRKLYVECERACDDLVLEAGTKASDYANHLVEVARSLISSKWAPSLEVAMAKKSALEGRLLAIFNENKPRNRIKLSTALIIGFLGISFMMLLACVQPEAQNIQVLDLADVLTLELSFGDEKTITKDEFLLAEPKMMNVTSKGDILLADEGRIKVFDDNGKEKKIFGGVGQGPGEFYSSHVPYLSPEGYLIVVDASFSGGSSETYYSGSRLDDFYNLFSPEYTFIEKIRFGNSLRVEEYLKTKDLDVENLYNVRKIIAINTSEKVYEIAMKDKLTGSDITNYSVILYENADMVVPLLQTRLIGRTEGFSSLQKSLGELHWEVLPDRRVVYVDANEDTYKKRTGSFYTIHLVSLDGIEVKQITHTFTPVEYPESLKNPPEYKGFLESIRKRREREAKAFRDKKYYPSIERMKIDGNYAFMFTYFENDDEEILTDVFDLEAGKYITSVYFPFIPADIKNGYAYRRGKSEEGFYVIEKYKINPAVYGK